MPAPSSRPPRATPPSRPPPNGKSSDIPPPAPTATTSSPAAHHYPADIIRPGMLYGKILRRPSLGEAQADIDLGQAASRRHCRPRRRLHRRRRTQFPVAGKRRRAGQAAKWNESAAPSSTTLYDYLRDNARGGVPENPFQRRARRRRQKLSATFNVPYIQHCPMEPRAAVAEWDDAGKVTIWTSSQNPFGVRREVAAAFHIPENKVRVIVPDFGGGFGGKHTGETAVEAARLAQVREKTRRRTLDTRPKNSPGLTSGPPPSSISRRRSTPTGKSPAGT